jgi:hypothetical protein
VRVFAKRVVRGILGPKRDEMGGLGKPYNEDLQYLYSAPVIIRLNKQRRMRLVGHIVGMQGESNAYRLLVEKTKR